MAGTGKAELQAQLEKLKRSLAREKAKAARHQREHAEALQRQGAMADILKVIASSPSDVQPVFDAIVKSATVLIGGFSTTLCLVGDGKLHLRAYTSTSGAGDDAVRKFFPISVEGTQMGRAVQTSHHTVITNFETEEGIGPAERDLARARGFRSVVFVPLLRGDDIIGTLNVTRREAGEFSEHDVELLRTFADQAVIAIENVRLFNETREALERQTATADVLRVISGSPTDLTPVYRAILDNATRLCDAHISALFLWDGEYLRNAAHKATTPEMAEFFATFRHKPGPETATRRAALERRIVHVEDVQNDPSFSPAAVHRREDMRTILSVPLLREDALVGVITIWKRVVQRFSDKQIALVNTFADQAVIAIENVRLFNETREALERQTATADILEVMSRSRSDLRPMFDTIAENANRLCGGDQCVVGIVEGGLIHLRSIKAMTPEEEAHTRVDWPRPPGRGTVTARAVLTRSICHVPDVLEDPEYELGSTARAGGWRSVVSVPMIRDANPVGTISVMRRTPTPFSDAQIALLKTFADQAVIAIENVRLFNETREALEQQTATAEILRVISSTPTDVQPVFDAIVDSALRIFSGMRVAILLAEGNELRVVASGGSFDQNLLDTRVPLGRESASGLAVVERKVINIGDTEGPGVPPAARDNGRTWGFRALGAAPLLREREAIGAITVFMREPIGLSDKQLALLKTFADQAVIAIENTRLFNELQQRTEALTRSVGQLTALGEVGQAISSTLDQEQVLRTIVNRAVELSGLDSGSIYEFEEDRQVFHLRGARNIPDELVEMFRRQPIWLGEGAVGRAGMTREPVQIPDILATSYQTRARDLLLRAGSRALVAVPLLSEGRILGALAVTRGTPGPFAPEVIELLKTFATQSAIAIRNARLFREIEEKGRQLEVASRHKSDFLASMSHELRTPLNAILGFNEMILDGVYGEVPPDMSDPLADVQASGKHLLRLINNVLDLAKIEAGRMELALADYSVRDVVESVRATLRPLAEAKGLEFLASVPDDVPLAHGDAGRLIQCLMNLAGNSLKFTKVGRVALSVEHDGGTLVYRVADTGIGIAPDKIETLFTEFRQTDATIASEYGGTGLGLSITRKFVEMHGGRIWVESEPGRGSIFIFELPLRIDEGARA